MKKILAIAAILCATAVVIQAQDAAPAAPAAPAAKMGKKLTAEQQKVMDEMLAKYDTDKNGKLDKTERAAMSQEDKDKMTAAGLTRGKKAAAPAADMSTNAPAAGK
jgi:hypothetical protein